MSKKTINTDTNESEENQEVISLTPVLKAKVDDLLILEKQLVDSQDALKIQKEQIKEAYKAIAEALSIKPAVLKERLGLIIKTDEEPEILSGKKNSISFVESYMEKGGVPAKAKRSGNVENEQA